VIILAVHFVHHNSAPWRGMASQSLRRSVRRVSAYPLCQCSRIEGDGEREMAVNWHHFIS